MRRGNVLVVKLSVVYFAVSLLIGCKTSKSSAPHQPTNDPVVYKGVINPECDVEMSYGSYGSGIDDSAYTATMLLISRWNQTFTATNIGREGETRLCIPVDGLKRRDIRQFIDSLKIIARSGRLVSVSIR